MSEETEEKFDEEANDDPFDGDEPDDSAIEDVEDGEIFETDDEIVDDDDFAEGDDTSDDSSDDDDNDDDEVEADLTAILQERITADDDKQPDEKPEAKTEDGDEVKVVEKKEDEIHCPSCFLLVSQTAIDKDEECPHCGAPV